MFNLRQIAVAGIVLVAGAGSFLGGSAGANAEAPTVAARTTVGSLTIKPATNLKNGQVVKIRISNFGSYTGKVTIVQCNPSVIADSNNNRKYCDARKSALKTVKVTNGKGSGTFKVKVGKAFKPGVAANKCAKGGKCLLVATTSSKNPQYAAFSQISFKK